MTGIHMWMLHVCCLTLLFGFVFLVLFVCLFVFSQICPNSPSRRVAATISDHHDQMALTGRGGGNGESRGSAARCPPSTGIGGGVCAHTATCALNSTRPASPLLRAPARPSSHRCTALHCDASGPVDCRSDSQLRTFHPSLPVVSPPQLFVDRRRRCDSELSAPLPPPLSARLSEPNRLAGCMSAVAAAVSLPTPHSLGVHSSGAMAGVPSHMHVGNSSISHVDSGSAAAAQLRPQVYGGGRQGAKPYQEDSFFSWCSPANRVIVGGIFGTITRQETSGAAAHCHCGRPLTFSCRFDLAALRRCLFQTAMAVTMACLHRRRLEMHRSHTCRPMRTVRPSTAAVHQWLRTTCSCPAGQLIREPATIPSHARISCRLCGVCMVAQSARSGAWTGGAPH